MQNQTDYEAVFMGIGGTLLFALYGLVFVYVFGGFGSLMVANANTPIEVHNTYFATNPSYDELTTYFENLAHSEGGERAFEVLIDGNLPEAIDSHLLGHSVGDILYAQEGLDGMSVCDDSLGFSCAHSIVINALLVDGEGIFDEINEVCASVGKPGSYAMCFHGFGHAVLAYNDFHLPEAVHMCGRVGTEQYGYYEAIECLGGAVMEMRGGIHNPIVWEENGKQYLDPENPLAMCQADYMPEEYKYMCYIYITPFIFDAVTENNFPEPADFEAATRYCDELTDQNHRSGCYGGFGKEYITLVHGRDVRKIADTSFADHQKINEWCAYAPTDEDTQSCVRFALYSTYKNGAITHQAAIQLCEAAAKQNIRDNCLRDFIGVAFSHHSSQEYAEMVCNDIPISHREQCFGRHDEVIRTFNDS